MPVTEIISDAPRVEYRCQHCVRLFHDVSQIGPGHRPYCPNCFSLECFVCSLCGQPEYRGQLRQWEENGVEVDTCDACYRERTIWLATPFSTTASYRKIRSIRKFGLELETSACPNYRTLRGQTNFGAKFDCSVRGMEFFSPVLYGDEGLASVEEFCNHADRLDFAVNNDCGYHLHIDMRDEEDTNLKSVAYAYLKTDALWRLLVDSFRANDCSYCRRPEYNRRDLESATDMPHFCDRWDRYAACNLQAYSKFGSFEIRLHQGTLDARTICNWIKAHLRFVDWAREKTLDEIDDAFRGSDANKWESLKAIFGDIDMNRYYGRIRRLRLGANSPREQVRAR